MSFDSSKHKVGDQVVVAWSQYGDNKLTLCRIAKVTPSGRFKVDGEWSNREFNPDGSERGRTTWGPWIRVEEANAEMTDKARSETITRSTLSEIQSAEKSIRSASWTLEQILKLASVLNEIRVEQESTKQPFPSNPQPVPPRTRSPHRK